MSKALSPKLLANVPRGSSRLTPTKVAANALAPSERSQAKLITTSCVPTSGLVRFQISILASSAS